MNTSTLEAVQEKEFFERIVKHRKELRRYAISLCSNPTTADDLVQEAFAKAIKNRHQFDGFNLGGWLSTILKNHYRGSLRKSSNKNELLVRSEEDEASILNYNPQGDESSTEDGDELSEILALLESLPPEQQESIRLVAIEGMKYEEAAEKLGVEVGTVKSRVNRARQSLLILRPSGGKQVTLREGIRRDDKNPKQRPIDVTGFTPVNPRNETGAEPVLMWLEISMLYVDERYQRDVTAEGMRNIRQIAENFEWRKFTPVIVAFDNQKYLIVDGQHRTYGACLRGLIKVPCMVTVGTLEEQANAFAAINSKVTQVSELQVFAAMLGAGDPEAVAITAICKKVDITICRYIKPQNHLKKGETIALKALQNVFRKTGAVGLELTLRCIQLRHHSDIGVLRSPIIKAVGTIIKTLDEARPPWLYEVASKIDFRVELIEAQKEEGLGSTQHKLEKRLFKLFRRDQ